MVSNRSEIISTTIIRTTTSPESVASVAISSRPARVSTCAVSEPVQDDMLTAMTEQFAGAGEILLVISISAALLAATLMGGCIAIGGGRV